MVKLKITEHTDRPDFISQLNQKLGIQFRIFQELRVGEDRIDKPQGDIFVFRSDKISRISHDEISTEEDAVVAVIETKNPHEKVLERHTDQLKKYLKRTNCRIGFITNYKDIRFFKFTRECRVIESDIFQSDNFENLALFVAKKIEESTKITVGYDVNEIIKFLEGTIDDLMAYTIRVDAHVWEHILRLSDELEKDAKIRELSEQEKKERDLFFQRSAAYIGIAQILFYCVLRNHVIERRLDKQYHDYPILRPLGIAHGVPTQIQDIIQDVPKNNYDFKSIFDEKHDIFSHLDDDAAEVLSKIVRKFEGISASFVIKQNLIGEIFQRLMPFETRKKFAAYYTRNKAAELLCELSILDQNQLIYDPACGSGTLLVKAYHRKKHLGLNQHTKLLEQIHGSDISDIAAIMSTVNLAIQDPAKWTNEVNIYPVDAFALISGLPRFTPHDQMTANGSKTVSPVFSPTQNYRFDVLLGNPPFTRGARLPLNTRDVLKNLDMVRKYKIHCDFKRINLYAFFLLIAPSLVKKEDGSIAFILPIGAINSEIMIEVWKALFNEKFGMKYLIEASDIDESFSDSQDQEIIVVLERDFDREARLVKLLGTLETKNISNLVSEIQSVDTTSKKTDDFLVQLIPQVELQNKPCMEWRVNPSQILILLYDKFIPLDKKQLNDFQKQRYLTDLSEHIQIITENASRPVDYWFIPNKFWEIEKIDDEKIFITATSSNTVVSKNLQSKKTLTLPKIFFIPSMARSLKEYTNYPPIIPENLINDFYLVDEHESQFDLKEYYKWGREGHKQNLFGESHSSFTAVENAGGIIKKINFSNSKTLALRFKTSLMGTRIITVGFLGKDQIDSDIFFSYLTSSLFLLDTLEKSRSRCAEFVILYQIDLYKIYRFPDFPNIEKHSESIDKILSASERYNGSTPLKDRPRLPELIQQVRTNKQHPLRKLDEAWFEALNIPISFIDTLYQEIEERLSDIVKKKEVEPDEDPTIIKQLGGQQKLF
jgi:type I restriction-modification system DNA methylase subunit